jgi:hypothetical protein
MRRHQSRGCRGRIGLTQTVEHGDLCLGIAQSLTVHGVSQCRPEPAGQNIHFLYGHFSPRKRQREQPGAGLCRNVIDRYFPIRKGRASGGDSGFEAVKALLIKCRADYPQPMTFTAAGATVLAAAP